MTTVRIAHAEPWPGKLSTGGFDTHGYLVVLADDAGHRAVPIWLGGDPGGGDLSQLLGSAYEIVTASAPQGLTARLLDAANASVTSVDIDVTAADVTELSPQVTVARIGLAGPAGTRQVTAALGLGLAMAAAAGAPVRLPDAVLDRVGVPVPGGDLLTPFLGRVPPAARPRPGRALKRPRFKPRNMDFADGLDRWDLDLTNHEDYSAAVDEQRCAVLSSAVPRPAGSAALVQAIFADDYRGATVVFRAQVRAAPRTPQAGPRLEILSHWWRTGRPREYHGVTVSGGRADALREAVAGLPAGQRRAVTLHYYAGLPPGQIAEPAGAARASLHKARLRLRAYLTEHRPDLVPDPRRTHVTTVRIARAESRIPPGPVPDNSPTYVIVLADDAGHRDLPIWLLGRDSHRFSDLLEPPPGATEPTAAVQAQTPDELTGRLLRAADARVTAVDIDELGPEVTAARIELTIPAGTRHVTARLPDGLAVAVTTGAPIRVADAVMDRLAVPMGAGRAGSLPDQTARDLRADYRPRYEPRNMAFADGLDGWGLGGSFAENAIESHWQDYACATEHGVAVLSAAVPRPEGFAFLAQEMYPDDYHGAAVVFRGQFRVQDGTDATRAGLFLRMSKGLDIRGPLTEQAVLADPDNHIVTIAGQPDWTSREVGARVPDDAYTVMFGIFLSGPGSIELRDPELTRDA